MDMSSIQTTKEKADVAWVKVTYALNELPSSKFYYSTLDYIGCLHPVQKTIGLASLLVQLSFDSQVAGIQRVIFVSITATQMNWTNIKCNGNGIQI